MQLLCTDWCTSCWTQKRGVVVSLWVQEETSQRDRNGEIYNFFITKKEKNAVSLFIAICLYSTNLFTKHNCIFPVFICLQYSPDASLLCKSRHSWIQSALPTSPWKPWLTVKKKSSASTQPFNSANLSHIHLMLPGFPHINMSYNNNLKEAYPLMVHMLPNSWVLTLGSKLSACKAVTSLVSKTHHISADRFIEMFLWVAVQFNSRVW